MKQIRYLAVFTCFALLALGWSSSTRAQEPSVKVRVFAPGLVNPRGLKFGPDGYLYVAEAGSPTGNQVLPEYSQTDRFSRASIVESTHRMVLRRPSEPAAFIRT